MQCAAVIIVFFDKIAPPQKCAGESVVDETLAMDTCHGNSPSLACLPPIILDSGILNDLIPQEESKLNEVQNAIKQLANKNNIKYILFITFATKVSFNLFIKANYN